MEENSIEKSLSDSLQKPYFTFVWAEDKNGLIGKEGTLPWNLPNEMKHFVEVTMDDVVVMGRKTYESIPNRPLKNRVNIVLTSNEDYEAPGAIVVHSKQAILDYVKDIEKPLHIIGGTTLFNLFIDEVDLLYRTVVEESFEGDTYMPEINYRYFRVVDSKEGVVDEKNIYPHHFFLKEKKKLSQPFDAQTN